MRSARRAGHHHRSIRHHCRLGRGDHGQAVKTLFTQEMLKHNFLAANVIYVSIAHKEEDIALYLEGVAKVLSYIEQALLGNIFDHIDGPLSHVGFQRLTKS